MDADRFDDVLRALVSHASRRSALGLLTGGLLTTVPVGLAKRAAAKKKEEEIEKAVAITTPVRPIL